MRRLPPPSPFRSAALIAFPLGGAQLDGESFYAAVLLGETPGSYGRIVERAQDGSFATVFEFSNQVLAAYPPILGLPGDGGTYYSYEQNWSVNPAQIDRLLAGNWYAVVTLDSGLYLGRLVLVPEPATLALLIGGAILMTISRRRARSSP